MDIDFDAPIEFSPPVSPGQRSEQYDEEKLNARRFMDKFNNDQSSYFLESKIRQILMRFPKTKI